MYKSNLITSNFLCSPLSPSSSAPLPRVQLDMPLGSLCETGCLVPMVADAAQSPRRVQRESRQCPVYPGGH